MAVTASFWAAVPAAQAFPEMKASTFTFLPAARVARFLGNVMLVVAVPAQSAAVAAVLVKLSAAPAAGQR